MKKIFRISILSVFLILAGCDDLPGKLSVIKNFEALIDGQTQTIEAGEYKTSINFKKKKLEAYVEVEKNSYKIILNVPDQVQIPSNGNFELKSALSGQPFDVLGSVQTTITESETKSGYETCQYQSYDTVCGQNGCYSVPITRNGSRFITYYDRHTDQKMQFDIVTQKNVLTKKASFSGETQFSEKIVINQGSCF